MMSYFARHIRAACGVFVVVFLLTNSGFTAVVHFCTMTSSSSPACCSPSQAANNPSKSTRTDSSELAIRAPLSDCHTTSVVGGLSDRPAVIQKANQSSSDKSILTLVLQSTQHQRLFSTASFRNGICFLDTPPPSVEKCILLGSFLI